MRNILKEFLDSNDSFRGQEPDETVALVLRWHPYIIWTQIALFFVAFLIPILIGTIFGNYLYKNNLFAVFLFISSLWYLLAWLALFYSITMYLLNVVLVTNKRIVSSVQKQLFDRSVSELHLSRVQDISTHTQGAIETFFNFGELEIQTAGAEEKFDFPMIPNPEQVKDTIMDMVSKEQGVIHV